MKKAVSVFVAFILIICSVQFAAFAADTTAVTGEFNYDYAMEVLEIVNRERKSAGVGELKMSRGLMEAAMLRAAETSVLFEHTRPNGQECFSLFDWQYAAGENIACGQSNPEEAMYSWMHSEGHRSNILSGSFSAIGIGCFARDGYLYWVQVFSGGSTVPFERSGAAQVKVDVALNKKGKTQVISSEAGHKTDSIVYPAGIGYKGEYYYGCACCGQLFDSGVINGIKSVKLSKTSYVCDGEAKKPSVTVRDSQGKTLVKNTDYTVKYPNGRKNPGEYSVKVTFKGKYEGSKTLTFSILPAVSSKVSLKAYVNTVKVSWKKVTGATGYQVYMATKKDGTYKKVADTADTSVFVRGIKSGKVYYFKVRAYTEKNSVLYGGFTQKLKTQTVKKK